LNEWINCGGCTCKAMSKETVNEISDDVHSGTVTSIREPENKLLNNAERRNDYEIEWKKLKRHSVKLPRVSFSKFYKEKGHLGLK
jgi:hypothetical protein